MHCGGVFGRVEYFLVGKGLNAALKSLRYSTSEELLVVSPSLWRLIEKFFVWKPLTANIHLPERTFDFVFGIPARSSFNTVQLRTLISDAKLREISTELKNYIPASYRPYLKLKKDAFGNEHRRVTIVVVNVQIEQDLKAA